MSLSRAALHGTAWGAGAALLFVAATFTYGALRSLGNKREGW